MKMLVIVFCLISSFVALADGGSTHSNDGNAAPAFIKIPRPQIPPPKLALDSSTENTHRALVNDAFRPNGAVESCA